MNGRIPPSLAGRTVRPGGDAGPVRIVAVTSPACPENPRDGQPAGTTSCPACRKRRVPAITRSSIKKLLWKVAFGVVVSVISSAIIGITIYIVDTIWRLF